MSGLVDSKSGLRIVRRTELERRPGIAEEMLDDGIIFINGPVGPEMAHAFGVQLLYISNQDPDRTVTLYINSPGGVVSDGLAIIDLCRSVSNPIATVGVGQCASMGAVLLACAGDRGLRSAMPNCETMLHQPMSGVQGQASDILIAAEHVTRTRARLCEMLAKACGQPAEKIARDLDRDFWLAADEAKEYGLIDRVMGTSADVVRQVSK